MKDFEDFDNTTGEFPDVVANNATGPGATDGTPITEDVVNDIWGFFQALLNDVGATPTGTVESSSTSQLLDAINSVINKRLDLMAVQNTVSHAADNGYTDDFAAVDASDDDMVMVGAAAEIQRASIPFDSTGIEHVAAAGAYSGDFHACHYADFLSLFLLGGSGGEIEVTSDGSSPTAKTAGSSYSGTFLDAASNDSIAILVGSGEEVQSTTDGDTYTRRNTGANALQCAVWCPGINLFVIGGENGTIYTSPDGINLTARTPAASFAGTFGKAFWDATTSRVYLIGDGDTPQREVQSSADGITWVQELHTGSDQLQTIFRCGSVLAANGHNSKSYYVRKADGTWVETYGDINKEIELVQDSKYINTMRCVFHVGDAGLILSSAVNHYPF